MLLPISPDDLIRKSTGQGQPPPSWASSRPSGGKGNACDKYFLGVVLWGLGVLVLAFLHKWTQFSEIIFNC